ncbi:hypothetical protein C2S53_018351 [Perilla frutescens var. hirtella]|uniref:Uncharacterized protein n=1 Tax=Perilla frutescens var. hirtella TaxID=608512 RepID=A0AAD4IM86_PERFH|nr:hypothetical protein C2S53_018351 [Perilla frutescens var. hirtella]
MAAVVRIPLSTVRSEATSAGNGAPPPESRKPAAASARPLLSVSKPNWVSNVRKERATAPDPPCVVCRGSGRVDCYNCNGKGRTNHVELTMLPKGEWPKWCRSCGGSGLAYCARCLGTGEYRYIMGFHFMNKDADRSQDSPRNHQTSHSFTDLLLNSESGSDSSIL